MIYIAVCDDQIDHMKRLFQKVQAVCEKIPKRFDCHVYDGFLSAERVIDFMSTRPISILFLDIELKGINGFELASRINEEYPETIIIFVSSYENYVFKSFEYEPFRFIRKSHLDDELEPALLAAVDKHLRAGKTFLVDSTSGKLEIRHKDILYFESSHNYLVVHTVGGRNYSFRSTLTTLEEKLKGEDFCRIHHAYIVYLPSIKRIEGSASVIMKDDTTLPISARQKNVFKEAYIEYTNRRFAK